MIRNYLTFIILLVGLVTTSAFTESYRRTTDDMYSESYGAIIAEQQARERISTEAVIHGVIYEICDEHHACVQVNSLDEAKRQQELWRVEQIREREKVKSFPPVPVWQ